MKPENVFVVYSPKTDTIFSVHADKLFALRALSQYKEAQPSVSFAVAILAVVLNKIKNGMEVFY